MLCFACGIRPVAEGWGYFCGKACAVGYANDAVEERGPVWCETEQRWIEQGQDFITGLIGDALVCQHQAHALVLFDQKGRQRTITGSAPGEAAQSPVGEADDADDELPF